MLEKRVIYRSCRLSKISIKLCVIVGNSVHVSFSAVQVVLGFIGAANGCLMSLEVDKSSESGTKQ